ncbi:uroporphyrinogen-III synthase [Staphylococcus debuckii]|uniref:uroporphyrinogen-III synthase n=1 Tax=Staphylococcus debuckii TaxID=2044912 RepID=UPI000F42EC6A|nr:uroporphyrinogen-III synthase [Staphylococcus debuckii]AYU55433.1 uroporphyrinogen-III synthase [Staphylococcus debuckii]
MAAPVIMTQTSNLNEYVEEVIHLPFIRLKKLSFNQELLNDHYDWIIFSSKNAVKFFNEYYPKVDATHVAAIGEKTKKYCNQNGITVDFFPENFSQEGFINEFTVNKGNRILIPSSAAARPLLQTQLQEQNAEVVKIDLYEPEAYTENIEQAISLLRRGLASGIAFASSSAANYFFEEAEEANLSANYTYYAIGKPTFEKIKQFGYKAEMANEQTIDGLLNIIKESRNHK